MTRFWSRKANWAKAKETPCFFWFNLSLTESHSKSERFWYSYDRADLDVCQYIYMAIYMAIICIMFELSGARNERPLERLVMWRFSIWNVPIPKSLHSCNLGWPFCVSWKSILIAECVHLITAEFCCCDSCFISAWPIQHNTPPSCGLSAIRLHVLKIYSQEHYFRDDQSPLIPFVLIFSGFQYFIRQKKFMLKNERT